MFTNPLTIGPPRDPPGDDVSEPGRILDTMTVEAPTVWQRGRRYDVDGASRRFADIPDDPFERFHLLFDTRFDAVGRWGASHLGVDVPEERYITHTNPVETVEWLLPGWRVLSRLKTVHTVTWADSGDTFWSLAGRPQPRDRKGVREHLLLAQDTCSLYMKGRAEEPGSQARDREPLRWMVFSLPTTNVRPFFRSYGNPPVRSHHFRNWTPSERVWVINFALRSAVMAPSPLGLAQTLCERLANPPQEPKWYPDTDQARTLAQALAGKTGSGTHHSGASRKAALAQYAGELKAVRTMLALGAMPAWDHIISD